MGLMKIENLIRYTPRAVGLMEIEHLFRYTALAVGLKPSAIQGKARLRELERIMYSKTIKVRIYSCDFTAQTHRGDPAGKEFSTRSAPQIMHFTELYNHQGALRRRCATVRGMRCSPSLVDSASPELFYTAPRTQPLPRYFFVTVQYKRMKGERRAG